MTEEGYSAARLGLKLGLGHVSAGATSLFELGGMGERMGIRRGDASPMQAKSSRDPVGLHGCSGSTPSGDMLAGLAGA